MNNGKRDNERTLLLPNHRLHRRRHDTPAQHSQSTPTRDELVARTRTLWMLARFPLALLGVVGVVVIHWEQSRTRGVAAPAAPSVAQSAHQAITDHYSIGFVHKNNTSPQRHMVWIDEQMDRWEDWKRTGNLIDGFMEEESHSTLFHQHVKLAKKIVAWEAGRQNNAVHDGDAMEPRLEYKYTNVATPTKKTAYHVKDNFGHETQRLDKETLPQLDAIVADSEAEESLNSTLPNVRNEPWWQNMSGWFKKTWTRHEDDAHQVWLQLKSEAHSDKVGMWNASVHQEQEWYTLCIQNMHQLGSIMRSWWYSKGDQMKQEVEAIHHNFAAWWHQESDNGRLWWKQSRQAFRQFNRHTEEKGNLWWQMIQQTVRDDWNATKTKSKYLWDEAVVQSQVVLNSSKEEVVSDSKQLWNTTRDTEEQIWKALRTWYGAHATYAEELTLPLVYLNSTPAFGMLMNEYGWYDYSNDFFMLQGGWDTQLNQAYCPLASCAALLNSLRALIELPHDPAYDPYPYATQYGMLQSELEYINEHVVRYNETFDGILQPPGGLSLNQAKKVLDCFLSSTQFQATVHSLDPATLDLDQVRMDLSRALQDPLSRVIINYDRQMVGQIGGGHFSPLASYSDAEDRFLVLDVAKYKYPAAWIPTAQLLASMATVDHCGVSNVPQSQDLLPAHNDAFHNQTEYKELTKLMGCQPAYRGYILVRPNISL